jgi:hypothetical protein
MRANCTSDTDNNLHISRFKKTDDKLKDAPDNPAFFISGIRPDTGFDLLDIRPDTGY